MLAREKERDPVVVVRGLDRLVDDLRIALLDEHEYALVKLRVSEHLRFGLACNERCDLGVRHLRVNKELVLIVIVVLEQP